jgi:hypothetical protein
MCKSASAIFPKMNTTRSPSAPAGPAGPASSHHTSTSASAAAGGLRAALTALAATTASSGNAAALPEAVAAALSRVLTAVPAPVLAAPGAESGQLRRMLVAAVGEEWLRSAVASSWAAPSTSRPALALLTLAASDDALAPAACGCLGSLTAALGALAAGPAARLSEAGDAYVRAAGTCVAAMGRTPASRGGAAPTSPSPSPSPFSSPPFLVGADDFSALLTALATHARLHSLPRPATSAAALSCLAAALQRHEAWRHGNGGRTGAREAAVRARDAAAARTLAAAGGDVAGLCVGGDDEAADSSANLSATATTTLCAWLAAASPAPGTFHPLPPWSLALRSGLVRILATPDDWTTGAGDDEEDGDGDGEDAAMSQAGARRRAAKSAREAARCRALTLMTALLRTYGAAWLTTADPVAPAGTAGAGAPPPTTAKATLLLPRLIGGELKLCVDELEELLVLEVPSRGGAGPGQGNGAPAAPAAAAAAPSGPRPPPSRAVRAARLKRRQPALVRMLGCAVDAYMALVVAVATLWPEDGAPAPLPASPSPSITTPHHTPPVAPLIALHDSLSQSCIVLLTFLADAWHSDLRLAMRSAAAASRVVSSPTTSAAGPSVIEMDADEAASLLPRLAALEPALAMATAGACAYLFQDAGAFPEEFADALPLMLRTVWWRQTSAAAAPMRPLAAHALLPVISSRMDQERVRAALGADLQGLGAPLCEGTGIVSAVDAGAAAVREHARSLSVSVMASDAAEADGRPFPRASLAMCLRAAAVDRATLTAGALVDLLGAAQVTRAVRTVGGVDGVQLGARLLATHRDLLGAALRLRSRRTVELAGGVVGPSAASARALLALGRHYMAASALALRAAEGIRDALRAGEVLRPGATLGDEAAEAAAAAGGPTASTVAASMKELLALQVGSALERIREAAFELFQGLMPGGGEGGEGIGERGEGRASSSAEVEHRLFDAVLDVIGA